MPRLRLRLATATATATTATATTTTTTTATATATATPTTATTTTTTTTTTPATTATTTTSTTASTKASIATTAAWTSCHSVLGSVACMLLRRCSATSPSRPSASPFGRRPFAPLLLCFQGCVLTCLRFLEVTVDRLKLGFSAYARSHCRIFGQMP